MLPREFALSPWASSPWTNGVNLLLAMEAHERWLAAAAPADLPDELVRGAPRHGHRSMAAVDLPQMMGDTEGDLVPEFV
jgi:hypothetical protein